MCSHFLSDRRARALTYFATSIWSSVWCGKEEWNHGREITPRNLKPSQVTLLPYWSTSGGKSDVIEENSCLVAWNLVSGIRTRFREDNTEKDKLHLLLTRWWKRIMGSLQLCEEHGNFTQQCCWSYSWNKQVKPCRPVSVWIKKLDRFDFFYCTLVHTGVA